jgi:hypothetical protein
MLAVNSYDESPDDENEENAKGGDPLHRVDTMLRHGRGPGMLFFFRRPEAKRWSP